MRVALLGTIASSILGFRSELIRGLVLGGHEVYAFAIDFDDMTKERVRELGAIPVDYTFNRSGLNPFLDFFNVWKLAKVIRLVKPDVVFSYFSKPVIFGTLAAVIAGCKRRIGMLEGLGYAFTLGPNGIPKKAQLVRVVQVLLYRISFRYLERIIFLNPDDRMDLLERYNIKVANVSLLGGIGLNLLEYPYSMQRISPITFLFVGRLLAEKGIHDYVAAAKIVQRDYPDTKFVALGGLDMGNPGALSREELKSLIKSGVIEHPGHVTNVQDWLADSSVFVLPSYREGVPRSTQEAMAIGRPVITTDVPGCRETVVDGLNGWLVPPFSPKALAEKMRWFIENPDQIEVMGLESYELARERYDVNKVNQVLVGFIIGSDRLS